MKIIFGGPGCGKTTRLLAIMEEQLKRGVEPNRIAFVAFTKAAALEARERAIAKFGFTEEDLPWFRTLHSMSFKMAGFRQDEVMTSADWGEVASIMGERVDVLGVGEIAPTFSMMQRMHDYQRATQLTIEETYHRVFRGPVPWRRFQRFLRTVLEFKQDNFKGDFTDMLLEYREHGQPLNVDVAIIDEAQDLSPLQWQVAEKAFFDHADVYVAGDDDQAIYKWAGANPESFLGYEAEHEVLPLSYRLSPSVYNLARRLVGLIDNRVPKEYACRDKPGGVFYIDAAQVDYREGTWLLLARNKYLLAPLREILMSQGYAIPEAIKREDIRAIRAWERLRRGDPVRGMDAASIFKALGRKVEKDLHDENLYGAGDLNLDVSKLWHQSLRGGIALRQIDYYLACLRRGENLDAPRINLSTVHGAKGREADNVVVCTDWSRRTEKGYWIDPEAEHRVFFVAVTRARQNLYLHRPTSPSFYRHVGYN